ncbi:putative nuclease HARBI1 [Saccostrea echinata]|uniref:putative nuclease HARBI1 n=1 Tax=Saccostrea echinata TaxID=191078 RepID=UPI002A8368F7|nr:putative nuclease HARBI1 [Saccostrea echinata]
MENSRKRKAVNFIFVCLNESSDSDDEDDDLTDVLVAMSELNPQRRKPQNRHRQRNYVENVVANFRIDEFKTFFRIGRVSMQCLQEKICETCLEENISGILCREASGGTVQKPLPDRILMFLWFMSSQDKYASIADRFGMSESTSSYAIRNLIAFIHDHLLSKVVAWPTVAEQQEIQDMYWDLKRFPGIVGMIDGTHISITKPAERGIDYYNRKDYYSVVLQAVVREDLRFIDVFAGFPGKVHDARIFHNSPLFIHGQALCREGHLLGDSAYPNLTWLLTPFRDNGHLTEAQNHFNYVHSSIRSNVERAFGILKGRFKRLKHIDQKNVSDIVRTILTACVLHNICILNHDEFEELVNEDNNVPQLLPFFENYDQNALNDGAIKRLNIARQL